MQLNQVINYYVGQKAWIFTLECATAEWLSEALKYSPNLQYGKEVTLENAASILKNGYPLMLRRLSDMEEEEAVELVKLQTDQMWHESIDIFQIKYNHIHFMDGSKWYGDGVEEFNDCYCYFNALQPRQFHLLLQRGFDLWNLIEQGDAVDVKTITS